MPFANRLVAINAVTGQGINYSASHVACLGGGGKALAASVIRWSDFPL